MKNIIMFFLVLITCSLGQHISSDPIYLFAHGLYSDQTRSTYYERCYTPVVLPDSTQIQVTVRSGHTHKWEFSDCKDVRFWIIQQPLHAFNFPDAHRGSEFFDSSQTSLGGENEISALANAYEKIKFDPVILMGMSRGASTILNFLATRHPSNVVAAVVESPFDSIINTLNTHCGAVWPSVFSLVLHTSPNVLFGKFDRHGVFPIKVVDKIDPALPIIIIASLKDSYIPASNSAALYIKLKETHHEHVYFVLLEKGEHAYLLEDNDADLYLHAVHAFYKKYNLPHNPIFAQHGEHILAQCQPTKKVVEDAIKHKKTFIVR